MKVLFVCTGNICRSPIAEKLLERHSAERGLGLCVSSAGTRALNGKPMHPESRRVLRELGVEPGDFESRMLTADIAANCDLLLGMTRDHRAVARQLAPARWKRMFALRELTVGDTSFDQRTGLTSGPTDPCLDIRDPIGRSPDLFDEVARDIESSIHPVISWIEKLEAHSTGRHHLAK
jgi:protein-tyrosine phosphatase